MLLNKLLFYFGFYVTLQVIALLWVLCCLTRYCFTLGSMLFYKLLFNFGFYDTLQAFFPWVLF